MKWFLCFLIVISSYLFGASLSGNEKKKLRSLISVRDLTAELLRSIEYIRTPLSEFFNGYKDGFLEETGFLSKLRNRNARDFFSAWEEAGKTLVLTEKAESAFISLGSDLGRLPFEEQKKKARYCLSVFEEEAEALSKTLPDRSKSIKAVSTLAGIMISILLI